MDAKSGEGESRAAGGEIHWPARLPVMALLVLAAVQLLLVAAVGLSPWKGGGFGMFSTLDNSNFRTVRVIAVEGGQERPLEMPPDTRRLRRAIRILPFHPWLARLASDAFRLAPHAREIRIEVWRIAFDPRGLTPSQHLLTRAVFRAGS